MFAFLLIAIAAGLSSISAQQDQGSDVADCQFSFFVFVEVSPGADCYFNESKKCSGDYPTWTMHGMWPSNDEGSHPAYCNRSAKFDAKNINDLMPQMKKYWPNLIPPHDWDPSCPLNHNTSYLWCHEWLKHGTCSQCIDELSTEHGFFSKVLELYNTKMNYATYVLEKYNIVPSTTHPYKMSDFASAFESAWGEGKHPVLNCKQDYDRQVLDAIRTCLNKEYEPIRCPDSVYYEKTCTDDKLIYYLPYSPK